MRYVMSKHTLSSLSRRVRAWALPLLLSSAAHAQAQTQAQAQEPPRLSEADVVQLLLTYNPELQLALIEQAQAGSAVDLERGRYVTVFDATASATRSQTPVLPAMGDVLVASGTSVDVDAGLTRTFASGTTLSGRVGAQRATSDGVSTGQGSRTSFGLSSTLSVVQPLLRGAGSELGLSALRVAELQASAANLAAKSSASELLAAALRSYWELWYSERALTINRAARDLAAEKERNARAQVTAGALASVEELTFGAQLAELEESVVEAETQYEQRAIDLNLALGVDAALPQTDATPAPSTARDAELGLAQMAQQAEAQSYELGQLRFDIAIAEEQLKAARDPLSPRLDAFGELAARGLAADRAWPALEQVGTANALTARVGLSFEAPLDDLAQRSSLALAKLQLRAAQKRVDVLRTQLRARLRSAVAAHRRARERTALADRTVAIARALATAERDRFALGASIPLQVQQAEESLRQAELRLQRARVDQVLVGIELDLARGKLLSRYESLLARLPAPSRRALSP
jgi:outer membrane protein TolC